MAEFSPMLGAAYGGGLPMLIGEVSLIEPVPIEDVYCSGLARIEDLGSEARFVLYTNQVLYEAGDTEARVVKVKVVLPLSAIKEGVEMTLAFLARKAVTAAGHHLLRLVGKADQDETSSGVSIG